MSGPFKLKYTKNSFPFKALEEELITGAGKAVATDSEGLVAEAQKRASEKLIEGAIIWEPVDLSGGSPIKVILKESEMNSGSFNEIIFENQPGLIDGLL